jgi:hypothetical protein
MSFWIKLAFILIELGLAIAYGVLDNRGYYNSAAICEWVVALIYTFYVWSFAIDFIPAARTRHYASKETELETATTMEEDSTHRGWNDTAQEQNAYTDGRGYANGRTVNDVGYSNTGNIVSDNGRPEASRNF